MPNNNPAGHNQYTKRKDPSQLQPADASQPGDASMQSGERTDTEHTITNTQSGQPSIPMVNPTPARRGFAAMDEATQRGIASKGGQSG